MIIFAKKNGRDVKQDVLAKITNLEVECKNGELDLYKRFYHMVVLECVQYSIPMKYTLETRSVLENCIRNK